MTLLYLISGPCRNKFSFMERLTRSIIVMASGSGTTFEALVRGLEGTQIKIKALIASKPGIGAIEKSETLGIPTKVQGDDLLGILDSFEPDLIVLAGYLKKLTPEFIQQFKGKIINVHPSLLPKYGGKGMYGTKVHAAVKAAAESESGATVHWVTEDYDEGPIVDQVRIRLEKSDSIEEIESKVRAAEKELLISAVKKILLS